MLLRFDPFREFDRMASQLMSDVRTPRAMPMDAYRHDGALHVYFDLPGIDPDSIDMTVEQNVLTVSASRGQPQEEPDEMVVRERPQGSFSRQVFLGQGLNTEELEANYVNGVLYIKIPVLETAKPRRIPVAIDGGNQQAIAAGSPA